jgi:DNA-binding MarR family transcriptional regulator
MSAPNLKLVGGDLQRLDDLVQNRVILLANLLMRSATAHYRKLLGLPQVEWRIIALLGGRQSSGLKELAERAGRDKSQILRGVNSLIRRRLVSRQDSLDDNRAVKLALTERGSQMYLQLIEVAAQRNNRLLNGISTPKRAAFFEVLDQLTLAAGQVLEVEQRPSRRKARRG